MKTDGTRMIESGKFLIHKLQEGIAAARRTGPYYRSCGESFPNLVHYSSTKYKFQRLTIIVFRYRENIEPQLV